MSGWYPSAAVPPFAPAHGPKLVPPAAMYKLTDAPDARRASKALDSSVVVVFETASPL